MGKNASFAGIGRNNVRYIETNEKGEMCSEDLQSAIKDDIKNGLTPFFINATVGTTVMGAIDPISEIVNICNKNNIWVHIDGAFSGTVIFLNVPIVGKRVRGETWKRHASINYCKRC